MNPIRIAKNWISYRRTMNELANLSGSALNDIGLTRYDIRNIAAPLLPLIRLSQADPHGMRLCGERWIVESERTPKDNVRGTFSGAFLIPVRQTPC